jgi:hypothetical protein
VRGNLIATVPAAAEEYDFGFGVTPLKPGLISLHEYYSRSALEEVRGRVIAGETIPSTETPSGNLPECNIEFLWEPSTSQFCNKIAKVSLIDAVFRAVYYRRATHLSVICKQVAIISTTPTPYPRC